VYSWLADALDARHGMVIGTLYDDGFVTGTLTLSKAGELP